MDEWGREKERERERDYIYVYIYFNQIGCLKKLSLTGVKEMNSLLYLFW